MEGRPAILGLGFGLAVALATGAAKYGKLTIMANSGQFIGAVAGFQRRRPQPATVAPKPSLPR